MKLKHGSETGGRASELATSFCIYVGTRQVLAAVESFELLIGFQ